MESCHGWMEAHLTLWIGISIRRTFLEKSVGSYLPTLTGSIRLAMDREDSFASDRWEVSGTTSSPSILPFPFHSPLPWWEEEKVALKEQIRIEQMTYFLRLHYACAHILDGRLLIGNKRCNWRWLKRNYRTTSILDVAKVLRADHLLRASGSVLQEVSQSIIHFISQSNIRSVHKPCGRSVIPSRLISLQPTRAIINLSSFQSWIVVNRWLPYFEIHLADAYMYLTDKTCSRFDRPNPYKLKHRQRKSHEWRDKQEFVLS